MDVEIYGKFLFQKKFLLQRLINDHKKTTSIVNFWPKYQYKKGVVGIEFELNSKGSDFFGGRNPKIF